MPVISFGGGAGNYKVWLFYGYTLFNSNMLMLYTAHLSCTMFCGCYGGAHCQNWQIRHVDDSDNVVKSNVFVD